LAEILESELRRAGVEELYRKLELPLSTVLAKMELAGVRIDAEGLRKLSAELSEKLKQLQKKVHQLAGEEFNLDSPKQLQQILFVKLKLPKGRRTKTGYSTDIDVLKKLALSHPIAAHLIEYRMLSKLKSGYVEALPGLVNPHTGRVHTSFIQTGTATGRLSSRDPNLQNIPVRGEEGMKIRRNFVPEKGHLFLSADYSQIELRILAHISGDRLLREAFARGEDIHRSTAAEVFNLTPDLVSAQMRRQAKVINFGIIYGMSAHGLATELGIKHSVAEEFISQYLQRYKGVKNYIDRTIAEARQRGYVETLLGRRRYVSGINSENASVRGAAERVAINTPIQGSAADLIKLAMLRIDEALSSSGLKARMLLQVHDELLFEVKKDQLRDVADLVRQEMETAMQLNVPVKVDISVGDNWADMEGL
jgi:DNA polymerase-1